MAQKKTAFPIELQRYLRDVDYPADKKTLLDTAHHNDAPDDVLEAIKDLPDEEFDSPAAVTKAFSESEEGGERKW